MKIQKQNAAWDRACGGNEKKHRPAATAKPIGSVAKALILLCSAGAAADALALPNLTLTKQASVPAVMPAGTFAYSLIAKNVGPDIASGAISISDTLPAGMGLSSIDIEDDNPIFGWACNYDGLLNKITCSRTTLGANVTAPKITINVTAPGLPQGSPPQQIVNTALISCATCQESSTSDNAGSVTTTIAYTDLALQKFSEHDSVPIGAANHYFLYVTNSSVAADSSAVAVTDALPAGMVGVYAWGAGWACSVAGSVGQNMTCMPQNGGGIPEGTLQVPGVSSPIKVAVLAPTQPGSAINQAEVASPADATPNNNTATATLAVHNTGSPFPDLALTNVAAGPATVPEGLAYNYVLTVSNNSATAEAGTVTIKAVLPDPTMSLMDVAGNGWTCTWMALEFGVPKTLVTCTRPGLAAGTTAPQITMKVLAGEPGTVKVRAWVAGTGDTNTSNNVADASKTVVASNAPDLAITNTSNPEFPEPVGRGMPYSYTLSVMNLGPGASVGTVTVVDVLPEGVGYVNASGNGWTCTENTGTVTCSRIASFSGSAPDITVSATAPNLPGTLINRAFVTSSAGDQNPEANNADNTLTAVVNLAPAAVNDTYSTPPGQTLTVVPAQGVLANDVDDDGDTLVAIQGAFPANGDLTLNADGSFTYEPDAGFTGTDSFTYRANDSVLDSANTTVTITVGNGDPGNQAPVADPQVLYTAQGTSKSITLTATDADGDALTYSVVALPNQGQLIGTAPNLVYAPPADFNGVATFTFKAMDAAPLDSNVATVTITVGDGGPGNQAPIADPQVLITPQGAPKPITLTATDPEGGVLSFSVVASPNPGQLTGAPPNLLYSPPAAFNGIATFTFKATDSAQLDSNMATVTITVGDGGAGNQAPVADPQVLITAQDTPKPITLTATDPEGGALDFSLAGPMSQGGQLTGTPPDLVYSPADGFNGVETFTFKASDGAFDSNVATVTITVGDGGSDNEPPVAVDDAIQVVPGGTATTLTGGASSVLANDIDPEGGLVHAEPSTDPAHGTLTLNSQGAFSYAHDINDPATSDSFQYLACDPDNECTTATVTITITDEPLNQLPVAVDDAIHVVPGGTATVLVDGNESVLDNDVDPGDTLKAILFSETAHGSLSLELDGSFNYANDGNDPSSSDSFIYEACDPFGACAAGEVTITITPDGGGNIAPVVKPNQMFQVAEDQLVGTVVATVVAIDDGLPNPPSALTYSITAGNADGTFAIAPTTGEITVEGPLDYETRSGYVLTVQVSDGELASTAQVTITITDVIDGPGVENAPPIVVDDAIQLVPGGTSTVLIGGADSVLANDSDPDGDALDATLLTPPSSGTLTFNADGTFSYENTELPSPTSDSFEYQACDVHDICTNGLVTVTITDNPTNDLPHAADDAVEVAPGGVANVLIGGASSVLANDNDLDGDILSATLLSTTHHGVLTFSADGTFTYANDVTDPAAGDSFLYEACDTQGACDAAEVTIAVSQALPVVNCILSTQVHEVGDAVLLDLSLLFTAPQGQGLSYDADGLPLSLSVNAGTGLLTGTLVSGDVIGSPYLSSLMATTVPGNATASEGVNFVVLASDEILLRNGFDLPGAGQPCQ